MFILDPAFSATSHEVGDLGLCHVRLQADRRYAWLVLIPRIEDAVEIEDLEPADRGRLLDEILAAGGAVRAIGAALGRPVDKLNIGQLGNITRQLHIHVIGRRSDDPAWPGPVWGHSPAEPYHHPDLGASLEAARTILDL